MFIYNRMAAALYAMEWANGRNPVWANDSAPIGGGDCTNFVSQALYTGGWVMRYPTNTYKGVFSWYSRMLDYARKDRSKSWASANHFSLFLKWSGRARPCLLTEILAGDILQQDLPGHDHPSHTMMVTQVSQGRIYLSYHSSNYLNTPLDDVLTRAKGSNFTWWKIRDVYES